MLFVHGGFPYIVKCLPDWNQQGAFAYRHYILFELAYFVMYTVIFQNGLINISILFVGCTNSCIYMVAGVLAALLDAWIILAMSGMVNVPRDVSRHFMELFVT